MVTLASAGTATVSTTYTALGSDRCVKLPLNTATVSGFGAWCGGSAMDSVFVVNQMYMLSFDVGGGATTATATILGDGAGNVRFVRLNNSPRVLEVYDGGGTLRATSVSTWSTSALTRFWVLFDFLDTNNTKIAIWGPNGTLESYQITGISRATFRGSPSGAMVFGDKQTSSSKGADIYGGVIAEVSSIVGDNPLWQRYPVLQLAGGGACPPAGDGSFSEFNGTETGGGTDAGNDTYANVSSNTNGHGAHNDLNAPTSAGSDGDTSYNGIWDGVTGTGNSLRQTYTFSASNPVPSGYLVRFGELGQVTKITGGTKVGSNGMLYDGSNTLILAYTQPSTSYAGTKTTFTTNPAGTALVRGDFAGGGTTEFGARSLTVAEAGGLTIGARITTQPGPVAVFYDGTQWLGTLPSGAQY